MQKVTLMENLSLWTSLQQEKTVFPALQEKLVVDVVVVGSGITGILTALELVKQNKKVALIESGLIGWGTTGFSTGNLYIPVQPYYQHIKSKFGADTVKQVIQARKEAIDYLENIIRENEIDCHFFRRPWFMYTNKDENLATLEKEFEIYQEANLPIKYSEKFDLPFKIKKAAIIENQARFNPLEFVARLAKILQKKGCLIYENTSIEFIKENEQCIVKTAQGRVSADQVVIATHTPKGINHVQFHIAPYRSYAVAVELESGNYPVGHYWDLDEPTYISSTHSTQSDKLDMLIVAGQHHKVGQCKDHLQNYKKIKHYIHQNYDAKVKNQWSAQHYQAADDIPYIGYANRETKNIFIATGFFADGLTYGVMAGKIISDLILNIKNPLSKTFSPERSTLLASAKKLIKENTNVFCQYAKDLPLNVVAKNFKEIQAGEGKTIEIAGEKYAAFRDDKNKLHVVSAICTHMKCVVNWNNAEKTWDCPCHGSRFSTDGKVIEGPAYTDLPKKESNE